MLICQQTIKSWTENLADFISSFQSFEETLRAAAGNVMGKFDQLTFKMLINNLKSTDYQVVVDTLEQLANEKRSISIPPIYFLSTSHPDQRIRVKAAAALSSIDSESEAVNLVQGKTSQDAVRILIQKYGNFKS